MNKLLLLLFCFFFYLLPAQRTPYLEKQVSVVLSNAPLEELFQTIEQQTGATFSYNPKLIQNHPKINLNLQQKSVRIVLKKALGETISFKERGKYIILQKEKPLEKKKIIEGYINEPLTGRNLNRATVYEKNSYASAVTNQYGYFRIEVPEEDTSVIMVSKEGQTDTVLAASKKSEFIEMSFTPKKDTILVTDSLGKTSVKAREDSVSKKNSFLPDWLISEKLIINTLNLNDTFFRGVSLSILPFVSTNRMLTGNSVNNIAFNLTVGYCQEIRVAEFGIINIVRDNVRYVQLGYIGNIVGKHMEGYQSAGVFNICSSLYGVQNSGVFNICQDMQGVQMASIFNRSVRAFGGQLAGVYNQASLFHGLQISGVYNKSKTLNGFQLSGIINRCNTLSGAQLAGIINISHLKDTSLKASPYKEYNTLPEIKYLDQEQKNQFAGILNIADTSKIQIASILNISKENSNLQLSGIFNYAKKAGGSQITSVINVAGEFDKIQLGVLNFSDTSVGVPIGILSFVRKGYHCLELSMDESFQTSISFRTGIKKFYNIIQTGAPAKGTYSERWFLGYGLGSAWMVAKNKDLFFELMSKNHLKQTNFDHSIKMHSFSIGMDYQWKKNIAFRGSFSFNALNYKTNDTWQSSQKEKIVPFSLHSSRYSDSETIVWFGVQFGIRFF